VFRFGRFQGHVEEAGRVLPQAVHSADLPPAKLAVPGGLRDNRLRKVSLSVLTTARRDPVLVLDVVLPGDAGAADVVEFMAPTTVDRGEIGVDGRPVTSWLTDQLGVSAPLAFGRNVHQDSARMVDRLGTVVRTRADALEAATQEERERRDRILTAVLAIGSLIALPPALLLAFFGVTSPDIDPTVSILNLGRYWVAYALAWLPFTLIVSAGFWLRRRIRMHNPRLSSPGGDLVEVPARVRVPAQRTGGDDHTTGSEAAGGCRGAALPGGSEPLPPVGTKA
jgi:hypothetical protein